MIAHWCRQLPPVQAPLRALWLMGGSILLALLSYGFRAEVWPNHPAIGKWSLMLLPFSLVVAMLQLLSTLQCWITAATSPGWLLLRAGMAAVQVGTALLLTVVLLGSLIVLALLA